ncbi:MAG: pyroglutamyl-peptidase I [Proteobacteria bacterium]|nr:pyroglutamyl-peptidase I [Pseudomonadota bacterium]
MTWLVTAYEPFGGAQTNSSLILLNRLREKDWQGSIDFFGLVPVVFAEAWTVVRRELERRPHVKGVLALGQAEWRTKISLERIALNWIDASIPDNDGAQPRNCRINDNAPDVLWSNIPWENLEHSAQRELSYSAGTHLCNFLLYNLLHWGQDNGKTCGFVHIPLLQSQTDAALQKYLPRMPDDIAIGCLSEILSFLLTRNT